MQDKGGGGGSGRGLEKAITGAVTGIAEEFSKLFGGGKSSPAPKAPAAPAAPKEPSKNQIALANQKYPGFVASGGTVENFNKKALELPDDKAAADDAVLGLKNYGLSSTTMIPDSEKKEQLPSFQTMQEREAEKAEQRKLTQREQLGLSNPVEDEALLKTGVEPKKKLETKRLSWEEYNALTPRQRSAVNVNSSIYRAVQKDLKMQDEYAKMERTSQEQANYDKDVLRLFGEERGSDENIFAPETIAVLNDLKITEEFDDLDDYLSGDVLFTAKDLDKLNAAEFNTADPAAQGPTSLTAAAVPTAHVEAEPPVNRLKGNLLQEQQRLEQALAKGNNMLQTMYATQKASTANQVLSYGGLRKEPEFNVGFTPVEKEAEGTTGDLNQFFQAGFDALTLKSADPAETMRQVESQLDDESRKMWHSYITQRTRNAKQYDQPLLSNGSEQEKKFGRRDADELLQLIGFEEKGAARYGTR